MEQGDAIENHRGFWLHPPSDALIAAQNVDGPRYALVAGDDGGDGITYMGGAPGWGSYDHVHRWHGAPGYAGRHMEHCHPGGYGLRGSVVAQRPFARRHSVNSTRFAGSVAG